MTLKRLVPPASSLLESIRGVGYDPKSAIADLIDNSISAGATRIWVNFNWAGELSTVSVLDDGRGMDIPELETAMTLGSRDSTAERNECDLGRFGLGLKTASLSQCERLVVGSKTAGGPIAPRVWDMQIVRTTNDWVIDTECNPSESHLLRPLRGMDNGTLVLWCDVKRLVGLPLEATESTRDEFQRLSGEVEAHLGMIFHRFLEGSNPELRMYLNGASEEFRVRPWDPFYQRSSATQELSLARRGTKGGPVSLQGYVLPHKDRIPLSEVEAAAGPNGWIAHQGFFVYRARRLLVPGSWLGLGRPRRWGRDEQHKLARIRLDLPNRMDTAWSLDIKKSRATPPPELREWLTRMAEMVRASAREVFVHRGQRAMGSAKIPIQAVWVSGTGPAPTYFINRNHPVIKGFLDGSGPASSSAVLSLLESTVPVHRIWLDVSEKPEAPPPATQLTDGEIVSLARHFLASLMKQMKLTHDGALSQLLVTEPFSQFPHLLVGLEIE
jgi:hypothetical protein